MWVLGRIATFCFVWAFLCLFRWIVQYVIAGARLLWYLVEFVRQIPQQGFDKAELVLRGRCHLLVNQEISGFYLTCRYRPWRLIPLLLMIMTVSLFLMVDRSFP
ncbi:hypothetical protein [Blastopirellula marina]|uniref:hypothetical protein n=1 Tax=Blastopirellula marina TaxID=124 RepID=UPI0011B0202A|nr:hypothetical protein [Blastopirellula marina]